MEWPEFGARVKKRREQLGMSQQELASSLGLDQTKVSHIEKGTRRVDLVKELPVLANALKCTASDLCAMEPPGDDPVRLLVSQYFPGTYVDEFQLKKIRQFIEPVLQSFVQNAELDKKTSNQ